MATSISVEEETRDKLMILKLEERARSLDDILRKLIIQYRKDRLIRSHQEFRKRMDEKGLKLEDLIE